MMASSKMTVLPQPVGAATTIGRSVWRTSSKTVDWMRLKKGNLAKTFRYASGSSSTALSLFLDRGPVSKLPLE